ncbi:MAG: site-specific DNA-methyltransferase [Cyanobacteria bacterium MAG CAR4_bin_6]|nr:site-specific DNA-methyltransferase [Cyanobacteria bacterium MAG CAR4_bin_6]MCY4236149.1 site-specific DNA-methyltransferase [Cyanobacteria bacterium MAG CAR2_bin_4]
MVDVEQHNRAKQDVNGSRGCSLTIGNPTQNTLAGDAVRILVGDSRQVLGQLEPVTVQCCVTSPPYWGLRDYDHGNQIGTELSPEEYVSNLMAVFQGVRRVLRDNGTLWLNVGDGYARNGGTGRSGPNALVGNTKKLIQQRNCKVPNCWGLKDRDLMGLPWRVVFALQEDGWLLRSKITWIKKAPMPESVRNRPSNATEELFLFAKNPSYYYNNQAMREESGANLRNYWILGPDSSGVPHPAVFPRELARRCILLGSQPGDVILDPFSGSGTTGVVAAQSNRRAILVELNPVYAQQSQTRINQDLQLTMIP